MDSKRPSPARGRRALPLLLIPALVSLAACAAPTEDDATTGESTAAVQTDGMCNLRNPPNANSRYEQGNIQVESERTATGHRISRIRYIVLNSTYSDVDTALNSDYGKVLILPRTFHVRAVLETRDANGAFVSRPAPIEGWTVRTSDTVAKELVFDVKPFEIPFGTAIGFQFTQDRFILSDRHCNVSLYAFPDSLAEIEPWRSDRPTPGETCLEYYGKNTPTSPLPPGVRYAGPYCPM